MEGLKIIRERIQYSKYRMANELGVPHSQYKYLEEKALMLQLKLLKNLRKICERHSISLEDMHKALEAEVK